MLNLRDKVKNYPFSRFLKKYRTSYLKGLVWLVLVDFLNIVQPLLVKKAMDSIEAKALSIVWKAALAYLIVMVIQSIGRYWWRVYLIGTANYVASDLRKEFYGKIQKIPVRKYQSYRTGDIMSRATNDIESIRMALGPGILVALDAFIMFLMLVPAMFWLSWKLTLLTFAFYPLVPFLTAKIGDKVDFYFEKLQSALAGMSAFTQQTFSGVRLIKALVLESHSDQKFQDLSHGFVSEGRKLARYEAVFSPTLGLITQMGTFFILFFGGADVISGVITIGTFIAFQRFVVQLSWPMEAIGWSVTMTREAKAAERRIEELLQDSEVTESYPFLRSGDPKAELEIQELKYPIENFNLDLDGLKILPGKKIGLVGSVGSGKSTLFQILNRIYEPPAGTCFLKGQDIKTLSLKSLRSKVASVEQPVVLFSETVRDNLLLGLSSSDSPQDLFPVLEQVQLAEEIKELPGGLETTLGEKGITLSGGQRQRLALARALLRRPELLLLDDCFSAVDVECEQKIIESFFSNYPETSVLFSSHRLSVMPRLDEIWVMEKGRVISQGTHRELLKTCQLYRALWRESEEEVEREELLGEEG